MNDSSDRTALTSRLLLAGAGGNARFRSLFEQIWSASLPLIFDASAVTVADSPLAPDEGRLLGFLVLPYWGH